MGGILWSNEDSNLEKEQNDNQNNNNTDENYNNDNNNNTNSNNINNNNNITPLSNNTRPYSFQNYKQNPNQNINPLPFPKNYPNYDFNSNKNAFQKQMTSSDNNQLFLGKKIYRPKSQNENQNDISPKKILKITKIEENPQHQQQIETNNQINKMNQLLSKLMDENRNLKEENEKNTKLINSYNNRLKEIQKEMQIQVTQAINQIKNEKNENENNIRNIIKTAFNKYRQENEQKMDLIISEIPNKMEKDFEKKVKEFENMFINSYINQNKNKKNKEKEDIINLDEDLDENKNEEINNNKCILKKNEIAINTDIKKMKNKEGNNNIIESHILIEKRPFIFNNYSYQCLTQDLKFAVYQGAKNERFNLELKNNGDFPWPRDKTFLICDTNISSIFVDKIKLEALNPNDKYFVSVYFNNLEQLKPGKYKTYLDFNANNKNFGNKILIVLEILEKIIKFAYDPKIAEFRNNFKIDEKTLSDEVIKAALESNNNDIFKAFQSIYQD